MPLLQRKIAVLKGIAIVPVRDGADIRVSLGDRVLGRVALGDIYDPQTSGKVLIKDGVLLTEDHVEIIEEAGIEEVYVRSPIMCQSRRGICVACYGRDLASGKLVDIGEAVGVVAAQSIGEPGTQLTMRTFHLVVLRRIK